jgi:hypothetical protein
MYEFYRAVLRAARAVRRRRNDANFRGKSSWFSNGRNNVRASIDSSACLNRHFADEAAPRGQDRIAWLKGVARAGHMTSIARASSFGKRSSSWRVAAVRMSLLPRASVTVQSGRDSNRGRARGDAS